MIRFDSFPIFSHKPGDAKRVVIFSAKLPASPSLKKKPFRPSVTRSRSVLSHTEQMTGNP